MITLKTFSTIELSSLCNLECRYCVNRLIGPDRKRGIMSEQTFNLSLVWLEILCDRGTQKEVNLNGNGESCLDMDLPNRIRRVKDVMGDRTVMMCTNGINMTMDLAKKMKDAGLDRCDLSIHDAYHCRRTWNIFRKIGMSSVVNGGLIVSSHNWAGQLESENQVDINFKNQCDPLIEGRGYIQMEGNVTPCCYDYRDLGVFGDVRNDHLLEMPIRPYSLCPDCHQEIPKEVLWEGCKERSHREDQHDQFNRSELSL